MRAIGIKTVILGETASNTWPNYSLPSPSTPLSHSSHKGGEQRVNVYAFWPTQIGESIEGYRMIDTGHRYVETVLTSAGKYNISIILGNADVPWVDQGGQQSYKIQAALSHAILAELWRLYSPSHRQALSGFYNVVELSCSKKNQALREDSLMPQL